MKHAEAVAAAALALGLGATACSSGPKTLSAAEQTTVTDIATALDKTLSATSLTYTADEIQHGITAEFESQRTVVVLDRKERTSESILEHPTCPGTKRSDTDGPLRVEGRRFSDYYYTSYPLPAKVPDGQRWTASTTKTTDAGPETFLNVNMQAVAQLLGDATGVSSTGSGTYRVTFNPRTPAVGDLAGAQSGQFTINALGAVSEIDIYTPAAKSEKAKLCVHPQTFEYKIVFSTAAVTIARPADSATLFLDGKKKNYP